MARKITDLEQRGPEDVALDDLLIIYDTVQEKTTTIAASAFRGRGTFSSTDEPDIDNHVHAPDITVYLEGDLYHWIQGAQTVIYSVIDGAFEEIGEFRSPHTYTQDDLPLGANAADILGDGDTFQDNDVFVHGDYYHNTNTRIMYGPYRSGDNEAGFTYTPVLRLFVNTNNIIEVIVNAELVLGNVDAAKAIPFTGDVCLYQTPNGKTFKYLYDEAREVDADWDAARLEGWGVMEDITIPHTHNAIIDPVQDDLTYADGDYVLVHQDMETFLWGPYVIDQANDNDAWPTVVRLDDPSVRNTNVELGVDQAIYRNGDYQLVQSLLNIDQYLMGPYDRTGAGDWGLRVNLRHPRTFQTNQGVFATVDLFVLDAAGTFITGDYLEYTNNQGKRVMWGPYEVGNHNDFSDTNSNDLDQGKWTRENSDVQAVRDDTLYSEGNMIINNSGVIYGPYVLGQPTDILAWPDPINVPALAAAGNPVITRDDGTKSFTLRVDDADQFYLEEV